MFNNGRPVFQVLEGNDYSWNQVHEQISKEIEPSKWGNSLIILAFVKEHHLPVRGKPVSRRHRELVNKLDQKLELKIQTVNRNPNQIKPSVAGLVRTGLTVDGLRSVWFQKMEPETNYGWTVSVLAKFWLVEFEFSKTIRLGSVWFG